MLEYQVNDMTCGHCESSIRRAVAEVEPSAKVDVDLGNHKVRIDAAAPAERFEQAIKDAGFTPVPAAQAVSAKAGGCCGGCM